jgi:hypothetical protein
MSDKTKDPVLNLIHKRHPEYLNRIEHWNFLEQCYEGGRDWFTDNIFQYMKEGEKEYADRVERAYRFNHSREVVDLINKYLFRAVINRKEADAPDCVKKFWVEASRDCSDIGSFMRQVSKRTSTFGRTYIVVDNNMTGDLLTVKDENESESRIYAYMVKPQDVLDMSFDDMQELNWILIRERFRDDSNPFDVDSWELPRFRYRLWTRTEWFLIHTNEGNDGVTSEKMEAWVEENGVHGLGEVPVIPADHMEDDNLYFTPALINDIAYLDRAVGNYLSNLDAIIQDQTFSQLAMPAQAMMPGEETAIEQKLTQLGTKRIFLYNGEGGVAPQFLSPDPRQAELIITAIRTIINEIYHTVGMAGERTKQDNAMGIDNSSGVAKAYDFDRVNALLVSKATNLAKVENKLINLVCLWSGQDEPEEDLVAYSDSFDIRSLLDEFEIASRLTLIAAPDSTRRKQMEILIDKMFPSMGENEKDKLISDLSQWPVDILANPGTGSPMNTSKVPTQGSNQQGKVD